MVNRNPASSTAPFTDRFRTAESVVATKQADTTILLNLQSGRYYTLNPVSGLIWSVLATGASIDHVITRVKEEFDAPEDGLRNDVEALIASLLAAKLIRPEE